MLHPRKRTFHLARPRPLDWKTQGPPLLWAASSWANRTSPCVSVTWRKINPPLCFEKNEDWNIYIFFWQHCPSMQCSCVSTRAATVSHHLIRSGDQSQSEAALWEDEIVLYSWTQRECFSDTSITIHSVVLFVLIFAKRANGLIRWQQDE